MKNVNRFFTLGFRGSLFRRTVAVIVWGLLLTRAEPGRTQDIFGTGENEFSIEFVEIGNPGNPDDSGTTGSYHTPHGGVSTSFRMGTYEISRDMITKANAASGNLGITMQDMFNVGGNGADRPATGISWNEAARFVNWLNTSNGHSAAYKFALQPGDDAYSANADIELWLSGDAGYDASNPYRNTNAYYFLPSEDEWYKAAYYSGTGNTYYDYALGSDSIPTAVTGGTAAGTVVYKQGLLTGPADITNAGGLSAYGIMGMSGNVLEWNESAFDGINNSTDKDRGGRGGFWGHSESFMRSSYRSNFAPTYETLVGFRVASLIGAPPPPPPYQTIVFAEIEDQLISETVTLDVIATSGLTVSFAVSGPATLDGYELSFTGPGTVEVTAIQDGDDYWISATPVVRSFGVFFTLPPLVAIDMVTVGDTGNASDTSGYGAVNYEYQIGTYMTTNHEYVTFLNAVAKTDPYGLYNTEMAGDANVAGITRSGSSGNYSYSVIEGRGNAPVAYTSWFDAARFTNWLQNGALSSSSTETGAYTLDGDTSGVITANVNANAQYRIPTEDEWYKAAYYDPTLNGGTGGYFLNANGSDTMTGNNVFDSGSANFRAGDYATTPGNNTFSGSTYYLTDVGTYVNTANFYGTFDQAGLQWEWNDAVIEESYRGIRGGAWSNSDDSLRSSDRNSINPSFEGNSVGFRVAKAPVVQTIAFDEIGNQFTNDTVTLDATANSLLPVSFTVSGPAILDGNELSFTGPGTVEVTASQAGNDEWPAATPVVRTFVVFGVPVITQASFGTAGNEFGIEFVEVGNPGNADDAGAGGGSTSSPHGGVAYAFRMSTYEISQSDIDMAAASGLLQVTAGAHSGNQPAANITWYEAAAFVNWMNTSEGYHPAYDLTFSGEWSMAVWEASEQASTGVDGGTNPYRHRHAYYFLPGEDEWYKAAYHWNDGVTANYWDYATGGNLPPVGVAGGTAFGTAVYAGPSDPAEVDLAGGLSPYGTMGQNGNVWEWTESASDGVNDSSSEGRAFRSGGWLDAGENNLRSSSRQSGSPAFEVNDFGFRVAGLTEAPPAVQTLAFAEINGQLTTDTVTLAATANSGLSVSFAVTGPATLVENELSFTGVGTVEVTASQAGDDNWIAATPVLRSFEVFLTLPPHVTIDVVTVGDTGNADDASGHGAVNYEYQIGTYMTTNQEYVTFLNAVAKTDPYGLYNTDMADNANVAGITRSGSDGNYEYNVIAGRGNAPVAYTSWFDAARFTNWLHNGALSSSSTETGAYTLNGATSGVIIANADAQYRIPTEDEWYKAAYYDPTLNGGTGGYFLHANGSNTMPGNDGAVPGSANFVAGGYATTPGNDDYNDATYYLTDVGAYVNTENYYGTFDQAGLLLERNDTDMGGSSRGQRGGSFFSREDSLRSLYRAGISLESEFSGTGFRVVRLTVVPPAEQTIVFEAIDDQLTTDTVTLGASANSGLPVSFAVTGPVTRTGDTLSFTGPGTVVVTASREGGGDWAPAPDVVRTFEVTFPAEITGVSPNQGNIGGGIEVVTSGTALGDGTDITEVLLAGVSATILSQTTDSVTVQVNAAESAGAGGVVVQSTGSGSLTLVDGFDYLWLAAPVQLDPVDITSTGLVARWEPVPGADRYLLDVGDDRFKTYLSGFEKRNVAQNTQQLLTDLNPDWYAIRLYAENASGLSLPSRTVRVPTGSNRPYPTNPPGSGPASQGGVLLFNPASMFHGAGMVYEVESSDGTLVNALITPEGKLRLEMLEPGVALVTLTATDPVTGYISSQVLRIEVVADQPEVESNTVAALGSGTLLFTQNVRIRNTSGVDALGVRVLFSDLASGTTIQNWTGEAEDGRPFLDVGAAFPADGTLSFDIVYRATTSPEVSPPTLEFDYILTDIRPPLPGEGTRITRQRIIQEENALMLFEFSSRPGELYVVEYMNNFPDGDWMEVSLQPRAGTNRTQWIDSGPPATTPIEGVRVYRVKPIDEGEEP